MKFNSFDGFNWISINTALYTSAKIADLFAEFWILNCDSWCVQNPVEDVMGVLWMIFQPLLFGLIAAEVKVNKLSAETVGKLNFPSVKFVSALEP